MEKEKERARLAGVSPAELSAVEVAEDTQKERRLFQLHMCEVGAVLGGTWGQFGTGGTQGTAQSLSPSPPPKQPCVGVVRDPQLSPSHCVPTWLHPALVLPSMENPGAGGCLPPIAPRSEAAVLGWGGARVGKISSPHFVLLRAIEAPCLFCLGVMDGAEAPHPVGRLTRAADLRDSCAAGTRRLKSDFLEAKGSYLKKHLNYFAALFFFFLRELPSVLVIY